MSRCTTCGGEFGTAIFESFKDGELVCCKCAGIEASRLHRAQTVPKGCDSLGRIAVLIAIGADANDS